MRGYIAHLPDIRNLLRLEGPAQITSWSFISATDCGTLLSPYRPLPLKSGNIENWHFSHSPAGIQQFLREVFNPLSGKPSHLGIFIDSCWWMYTHRELGGGRLNRKQSCGVSNANPISIGMSRRHPPVVPEGGTPTPRAKQCCVRGSL